MREPVWNLIPESGEPLLQSLASDPRVISVEVTSLAQRAFLAFHRDAPSPQRVVQRALAVTRDGSVIGEVKIKIDFSAVEAKASSSWRPLMPVATIQLLVGLGAVFFVYRVSGRLERERALRIANGQLKLEIAERERAEAALLESEVRLKSVIDFFPAAICFKDTEGRFVRVNKIYEQWLNIEEGEYYGKNSVEYISGDFLDIIKEHDRRVVDTREVLEEEHLILYPDGKARSTLIVEFPVLDADGVCVGTGAINTDITERKNTEKHARHAQKMEVLGEMATGVAHELNQPLNIIRMSAETAGEMLEDGAASPEIVATLMGRITSQIDRAAAIIDHMRVFGRKASETAEPISIGDSVNNCAMFLREQMRLRGIELDISLPEDRLVVNGNAIELEQVVMNLLANARDAIEQKVELLRDGWWDGERIAVNVDYDHAICAVRIVVRDTGIGIPEDVLERIFDPFFTTKEIGRGTGLGLSISYGIVTEMGSTITAENETSGARFIVTLPATIVESAHFSEKISPILAAVQ